MKSTIILLFTLFLSQVALSKQDTCIKLRKYRAQCKKGERTQVHITCGGRWYRYWTDEYEMLKSQGIEEENIPDFIKPGMCIQVKTETMTMDCYDFLDYKVSLFFCRKQKKRICRKLKEDGFGDVMPKWPKKKKNPRQGESRYRSYNKTQGYITKPCSEVLK